MHLRSTLPEGAETSTEKFYIIKQLNSVSPKTSSVLMMKRKWIL